MICLSKNKTDQFINLFAKGSGLDIVTSPGTKGDIIFRSMAKRKLIK